MAHARNPDEIIPATSGELGMFGSVVRDVTGTDYFAVGAPRTKMYGAAMGGSVHVYRK